jgi:flagella basal body P-ring formation protein FlgA
LACALPAWAADFTAREQQVLDLVVRKLMQRHQIPKTDVEVSWADRPLRTMVSAVPEGAITLEVADNARLVGRSNVPVSIFVAGKKFRTIFPKVDIKVYQQVLIAQAPIARGEQPNAKDLELERKPVADTGTPPLTSLNTLAGAVAVRDIPAGTVLTAQMFKIPPVVKMGSVVTVTLIAGDITMITSAQARSNGAVGQIIKVMNLDSKREFTARVVGPDRVEVKLED